jgi:hypothetical protein
MPQRTRVANIGTAERRQRRFIGVAMLGLSAVLLLLFELNTLSRWWRLVLVLPLWVSMLGFFQDGAHT